MLSQESGGGTALGLSRRRGTAFLPAWTRIAPALFTLAWGGNHFTPLLHLYEEAGSYSLWQVNLLLGTYVGGLIPGLLVASALSDKHGRKPVLVYGLILSVLGSGLLAFGLASFGVLLAGRALAGFGVGVAMSVGTSWMKELSSAPFDLAASRTAGAKRPSLTLTLGFGLGAGITGVLAQWAPAPTMTPFLLHAALSCAALAAVCTAPESLPRSSRNTEAWWRDLRVPAAGHRTFRRLVLPMAPWVFAAAGVAYAIMPSIVQNQLGNWSTLYATALTVLTLGSGAMVQNLVPRINRATKGRASILGMTLMALGMILAAVTALVPSPLLALGVAVLLGVAYGICVVSGLITVQGIAEPEDLAGLTGLYYSLTYAGFLLPTLLAALLPIASYPMTLAAVSVICVSCLLLIARGTLEPKS